MIGNSKGKIGVSARGLLTSTTAETTSQVGDILKNAASSAAGLESLWTQGGPTRAVCASGMTHTVQVRPETLTFSSAEPGAVAAASSLCEYVITVTRPFHLAPPPPAQARPAQDRAGLYYRQAMPYVVTLTRLIPAPPPADTVKKAAPRRSRGHRTPPPAPVSPAPVPQYQVMQFLVFSPTGAPTHFAPLPQSPPRPYCKTPE